ncbi:hypothetical protein HZB96_02830, partial [Candidatus Gottesmanbacteria bacterium]|nr:hypothetical protein [Candidatus Gottesmanbacteria bacterium]
ATWFANGRRKFTDALEHLGVLPPEPEAWGYDIPGGTDIQTLKKYGRATNFDVCVEIILGTIALSVALSLWNAFTAKDEEESGGGGGHQ